MSIIQGKYKINLDGEEREIYSLKSKKLLDTESQRLQAWVTENWDVQVTGDLTVGEKYFIRVPAHTTGVFIPTLTGAVLISSITNINTKNIIASRTTVATINPLCFGFSNGMRECRGFLFRSTGTKDDFYELNDANEDFEAFIVCAGISGNISTLKQFMYKKNTSIPNKYLWLKPYNVSISLNAEMLMNGMYAADNPTVSAVLTPSIAVSAFMLKKRGGLDETDPINAISNFTSFRNEGSTRIFSGALGSYRDIYNIAADSSDNPTIGYLVKNSQNIGNLYATDVDIIDTICPTGIGSADNTMDTYNETGINVVFAGFAKHISIRKTGTNNYSISNLSMSRSFYISYGPSYSTTEELHIGDSLQVTTSQPYILLARKQNGARAADYERVLLPTS